MQSISAPPATTLVTWLLTTLVTAPIAIIIYRLYFHPLAKIPGPRLAPVSPLWQAWQVRQGRSLARLHDKYGPAVRIGPNEAMFNTKEAYETIYRAGSGFNKAPFYFITSSARGFINWLLNRPREDNLDFLSESNMPRYRLQRRLVGPVYTTANLKRFEPSVDTAIDRFAAELIASKGRKVDLNEWAVTHAAEALAQVTLRKSPGLWDKEEKIGLAKASRGMWRRMSTTGVLPLPNNLANVNRAFRETVAFFLGVLYDRRAMLILFGWVGENIGGRVKEMTTASKETGEFPPLPPADEPTDIVDDLIRLHLAKPDFTTSYLGNMAGTNIGAGVDTLESSLTAALVHIHRNPQVLRKVRAEVDKYCQSRSGGTDHLTYDEVTTDLPYTMACIREAMRMSPVLGMSVSRVTPPLSQSKGSPVVLSGYHIPPGTIVGCHPWALHRNRDVFGQDAEEYRPERWLENSKGTRSDMDRVNLIWGGPSRSCPGRHLGELILFKTVPELLRRFDMEVTLNHGIEESKMYFLSVINDVDVSFTPRAV